MKPASKQEKTMSSRLLTMKFMQRAAHTAAGKSTTPQVPDEATPSLQPNDTADTSSPPAKRINSRQTGPTSDLDAISTAIKSEEDKRAAAIARQAAEAGETEWVLDFPTGAVTEPRQRQDIVPLESYDAYHAHNEGDDDGRRGYGGFKRKKTTTESRQSTGTGTDENNTQATTRSTPLDDDEYDEVNSSFRDQRYREDREESKRKKLTKMNKGRGREKDMSKLSSISGAGISKPSGPQGSKKNKRER